MTVVGKAVTAAFYGRPARYAYVNGCSTGGRQGLSEAQRYPEDYDGILSAAPAINWSRFIPAELWPQLVMLEEGNFLPQERSCGTA
jgi:feruloyl esterase